MKLNRINLSYRQWAFVVLSIIYSMAAVPILKSTWNNNGASAGFNGQLGPNGTDAWLGVAYVTMSAASAFTLSRFDKPRKSRSNMPLQYHLLATTITSLAAVVGWTFLTYFGWRYVVWIVIVGWGSYGVHWLRVHDNPKGIAKQEAFR